MAGTSAESTTTPPDTLINARSFLRLHIILCVAAVSVFIAYTPTTIEQHRYEFFRKLSNVPVQSVQDGLLGIFASYEHKLFGDGTKGAKVLDQIDDSLSDYVEENYPERSQSFQAEVEQKIETAFEIDGVTELMGTMFLDLRPVSIMERFSSFENVGFNAELRRLLFYAENDKAFGLYGGTLGQIQLADLLFLVEQVNQPEMYAYLPCDEDEFSQLVLSALVFPQNYNFYEILLRSKLTNYLNVEGCGARELTFSLFDGKTQRQFSLKLQKERIQFSFGRQGKEVLAKVLGFGMDEESISIPAALRELPTTENLKTVDKLLQKYEEKAKSVASRPEATVLGLNLPLNAAYVFSALSMFVFVLFHGLSYLKFLTYETDIRSFAKHFFWLPLNGDFLVEGRKRCNFVNTASYFIMLIVIPFSSVFVINFKFYSSTKFQILGPVLYGAVLLLSVVFLIQNSRKCISAM